MNGYFNRHAQTCVGALGELSRHRLGSLLIVAVIGTALALPSAFNLIVQNGRALAGGWKELRDFSAYLRPGVSVDDANRLGDQLKVMEGVDSVHLITAEQALDKFEGDSGFSAVLAALDENPLPHTVVVRPTADATPEALQDIEQYLLVRTDVELVKLDTEWVARLNAILDLARRAVWITALMLVGAIIVIIGNTIRLDIQNRRAEIEVSKLLGASDAFVRRPFLYLGFWYGFFGSCFALVLLSLGLWLLSGPVERVVDLYGGGFEALGVTPETVATVLVCGVLAGLGGAWTAVARHLSAIQPNV